MTDKLIADYEKAVLKLAEARKKVQDRKDKYEKQGKEDYQKHILKWVLDEVLK